MKERDLGRVLVKAPGWHLTSGGRLLLGEDHLSFKIDTIDRLIGRKGFERRDEVKKRKVVRSSLRRMLSVQIETDRGTYLFMFPEILRGPPPEERIELFVSWLGGAETD